MVKTMKWSKLLSQKRFGDTRAAAKDSGRSPFQRDYDRIVFSSAFRRMQDKTQVFPLAESDYVRTRLTHSIEASCVGRSLGRIVGAELIKKYGKELKGYTADDFGAIVAAATLAHDIGNPPFGHSGENAIQDFFTGNNNGKQCMRRVSEKEYDSSADFMFFEGNAQGFRILTTLQHSKRPWGMQLTCATLAAYMKYPREACHEAEKLKEIKYFKKFGFFKPERKKFEKVASEVGLFRKNIVDNVFSWVRHPLAFLVEAADDICYAIIDLEDGVRLGCVKYNEAQRLLLSLFVSKKEKNSVVKGLKKIPFEKEKIEYLRAAAIGELINQFAAAFMIHEAEMLKGNFFKSLEDKIKANKALKAIKEKDKFKVYTERNAVYIEAAGFEVLDFLLNALLASAQEVAEQKKNASYRAKKILQLIPVQFKKSNEEVDEDPYTRTIQITDYVSGMTDSFAVSMYRKIKGIALPHPG
ncbi:MAG: deoxyguanosinetriphosphate triphosphohydrolase [Deltaproteobacteria bacterium]|nr:deoxyguanosinetriphosphate triphosphohydrolase [Deltaproteobacteria bacterium]